LFGSLWREGMDDSWQDISEPRILVPRLLSDDQPRVVQELSRRLEATGRIDTAAAFTAAVLDREALCPTLLEGGMAIPHARGGAVRRLSLAIGRSVHGLRWGEDRRHAVDLVFLCAVPLTDVDRYLRLIAGLSRFLRQDENVQRFRAAAQPEAMASLVAEMVEHLPE
jgi:mannitol/fructose-specific phosphotransferase system IIA component (Ntr-type)